MMASAWPQAVIFDMDGLLFDTERLGRECWQQAAREFGFEISNQLYEEAIGRPVSATLELFSSRLGAGFDAQAVRARRLELAKQKIESQGVPIKTGASELLSYLASRTVRCALVTSTDANRALDYLGRAGLRAAFSVVVTGDDAEHHKPAPDLYLVALKRLGLSAEQCLVLEDSDFGIQAAHAAGIRVVWVRDLKGIDLSMQRLAHASHANLLDVKEWLAR